MTPRATANLEEIAEHLRSRDPSAARSVRAAIYNGLETLLLFLLLGRRQRAERVRKFVTRRYGYILYYMVDEAADEIVILSIKHPAQRPEHTNA
ncbi:MAG TPA: type II toxin-antitoxin system RelE/ParE family toxin [Stellaceae bacterium]|nr:type II toxin-antitoxin system RelE/ParE family toxin [Stellaceae bacterium]